MSLRIGFDMDGTLADFGRAFHAVESRLFGPGPGLGEGLPEHEEEAQAAAASAGPSPHALRRRRDRIWETIQSTPNFWESLEPVDPSAVGRIHALMLQHSWEVFFITQRPKTAGDTVQRQTQRWLVEQGFDLPSVLVLGGSRGAAADALRLDYHVDDSTQNCLDVLSASRARPILIVGGDDVVSVTSARKLGIGTAGSVGECLDILEDASGAALQPGLFARLATRVGWKQGDAKNSRQRDSRG